MGTSPEGKTMPTRRLVILCSVYFVFACLVVFAFAGGSADPDLWGHVKFGLDALADGKLFLTKDPYSYTAFAGPWINHEWLSELSFALVYKAWGAIGLSALRIGICLLFFAILAFSLLVRKVSPWAALGVLGVGLYLMSSQQAYLHLTRPQLFTYLFFVLEVWLLRDGDNRPRLLWLLPPLFALWINFHGGVLAGLAVLWIWVVVAVADAVWRRESVRGKAELVSAAVASSLFCLINPYGAGLIVFLLKTATVLRPEITEWHPLHVVTVRSAVYLALAFFCVSLFKGRWRERLPAAVVLCVCLLLPFKAQRHIPLAVSSAVVLVAPALVAAMTSANFLARWGTLGGWFASLGSRYQDAIADAQRGTRLACLIALASLLAGGALLARSLPKAAAINITDDMPVAAIDLIQRSGIAGDILCPFNWGEYCIWHLYPRLKVDMDGRRETVYDDSTYKQYLDFMYGLRSWDELLKKPTDVVLADRSTASFSLMLMNPAWRLVYADRQAAIFLPASAENRIKASLPPRMDLPREFP